MVTTKLYRMIIQKILLFLWSFFADTSMVADMAMMTQAITQKDIPICYRGKRRYNFAILLDIDRTVSELRNECINEYKNEWDPDAVVNAFRRYYEINIDFYMKMGHAKTDSFVPDFGNYLIETLGPYTKSAVILSS
jgi:hypothetical protein